MWQNPEFALVMAHAGDPLLSTYDELLCYTLTHAGSEFIHQHIVDAWTAQRADASTKPIGLTFALIGLYLQCQHKQTGREIQLAHMRLAKQGGPWPTFSIPDRKGSMTVLEVMAKPAGPERDRAIHAWCDSVWAAWRPVHGQVAALAAQRGLVR